MLSDSLSPPPLPPPPPPPPPPLKILQSGESGHRDSTPSLSLSPSILIITAIITFVILASASIHLLLRLFSRSSSSSPPFIHRLSSSSSSSSSSSASTSTTPSSSSDQDPKTLIDSLPLFSLASSIASVPKSSLDCAVCLSPFHPDDQLRLLPACRHAFHSSCIDTWLRSTASCPLCRSSILLPPPPPPPPPQGPPPVADPSGSGSFRIEIGSVSRRRTTSEEDPPPQPPPHVRTYSLGSSFEYLVEEEVEAVLARVRRRPEGAKETDGGGPTPPGAEVVEAAGGGGRNWLKDYVDRLASSASSSFSSLRFSGRWSHRYDGGGGGGGGENWDLEGNQHWDEADSAFSAFYRWLVGV